MGFNSDTRGRKKSAARRHEREGWLPENGDSLSAKALAEGGRQEGAKGWGRCRDRERVNPFR